MCRTIQGLIQAVICAIQMVTRVIMTIFLLIENLLRMILQTFYNLLSFFFQLLSLLPFICVYVLTTKLKCNLCGSSGGCVSGAGSSGACECFLTLLAFIILLFIFSYNGVLDKMLYYIGYAVVQPGYFPNSTDFTGYTKTGLHGGVVTDTAGFPIIYDEEGQRVIAKWDALRSGSSPTLSPHIIKNPQFNPADRRFIEKYSEIKYIRLDSTDKQLMEKHFETKRDDIRLEITEKHGITETNMDNNNRIIDKQELEYLERLRNENGEYYEKDYNLRRPGRKHRHKNRKKIFEEYDSDERRIHKKRRRKHRRKTPNRNRKVHRKYERNKQRRKWKIGSNEEDALKNLEIYYDSLKSKTISNNSYVADSKRYSPMGNILSKIQTTIKKQPITRNSTWFEKHGYDCLEGTQSCYKYPLSKTTWIDAANYCLKDLTEPPFAHLFVPDDEYEMKIVNDWSWHKVPHEKYYYVGFYRNLKINNSKWITVFNDNQSSYYNKWDWFEPKSENCVGVSKSSGWLSTVPCQITSSDQNVYPFICEIEHDDCEKCKKIWSRETFRYYV